MISTHMGTVLKLYKYPQVRMCKVKKDKTTYNSVPFQGSKRGGKESVLMHLTKGAYYPKE